MITIKQIMAFLSDKQHDVCYMGEEDADITGFCPLDQLKDHCLTWVRDTGRLDTDRFRDFSRMLIILDAAGLEAARLKGLRIISCKNAKEVFFDILNRFFYEEEARRIAPGAVVETERIGKNVAVGHHCYIGKDVTIEDDVIIKNHVVIECKAHIGRGSIIHSGVVIGADGFGYYKDRNGSSVKVPHFGGVQIGRETEIGANTCIDRGTLGDTVIGDYVKIDDLCHIGHNARIENNVYVIALSAVGGSAVIQEGAYIAPGVMIKNQVTVGENTAIGMGSTVTKDIGANRIAAGAPQVKSMQVNARIREEFKR